MYPQNNSNNNPAYPYQQVPANFLNEGDPVMQAAYQQQQQQQQQAVQYRAQQQQQQQQYLQSQQIYQGSPAEYSNYSNQNPLQQQPPQMNVPYNQANNMNQPPPAPFPNPNFVPVVAPLLISDSVNIYTTLRYGGRKTLGRNIGQDALIQGVIRDPTVAALRDIWESLPLNFQGISLRSQNMLSADYVQRAIFQPLVIGNPQLSQEVICSGKVITASNFLAQKIRTNFMFGLFISLVAISMISIMEIVYANNVHDYDDYYYNDDDTYLVILYIVGQVWMVFQLILTLIAVRTVNMSLVSFVNGLQALYLVFALVVFICGVIYMQNLNDASQYTFLIQVFGVLFLICSVMIKFQLQQMKCYFRRLFVLVKWVPESDLI